VAASVLPGFITQDQPLFEHYPVRTRVSNARNEGVELIELVAEE